jgi:hypothetical protein
VNAAIDRSHTPAGFDLASHAGVVFGDNRIGRQLGNLALKAEARVTLVVGSLAGNALLGLISQCGLGWWWPYPMAALAIFLRLQGRRHSERSARVRGG